MYKETVMKDVLQRALVIGLAVHGANKAWFRSVRMAVKAVMGVPKEEVDSFNNPFESKEVKFCEIPEHIVKDVPFQSGHYIFTRTEDGLTRNVVLPADGESVVVVHDLTVTTTDSDLTWELRAFTIASHVKNSEDNFFLRTLPQSLIDTINNSLLVDYYPIFTIGELVLLTEDGLQYIKDNVDEGLRDTGDFDILFNDCQVGGAKQEHLEAFGFSIQMLQHFGYIKDLV